MGVANIYIYMHQILNKVKMYLFNKDITSSVLRIIVIILLVGVVYLYNNPKMKKIYFRWIKKVLQEISKKNK